MDKIRSHVLSLESLEEVRNLESQETMLDEGNRFETNGWSIERRNDGGERQLECGSGLNRVGDLWKNTAKVQSVDIASVMRMGRCC